MTRGGDNRKRLPPSVESAGWTAPVVALRPVGTECMSPAAAGFEGRKLLFSELQLKFDPQSCSWDRFCSLSDRELLKQNRGEK